MRVDEITTPALLLELSEFDRNLARVTDALAGSGVRLRPHGKAHKCVEIARRQIAHGAVGLCCQTVSEAEIFIRGGITDVLVTNQVLGRAKLECLARLARVAKVGICVDQAENIRSLQEAAASAGTSLDVYVEVNVGMNRCGVEPGGPVLVLAEAIARCRNLQFRGLQAYHGAAQHLRKPAERAQAIDDAVAKVKITQTRLEQRGLRAEVVTGAGTGTWALEAASGAYNEIQPGSYVFMDADYGRNCDQRGQPVAEFGQSLFVLTTVISCPSANRAVVDAGLKAHSVDSGLPLVANLPGTSYVKATDEHGIIAMTGNAKLRTGHKIRLIPGHCDPTVNLYDWIVGLRHDVVETVWPVAARGAFY